MTDQRSRLLLWLLIGLIGTGCSSGDSTLQPPALPSLRITVQGTRLIDALGREVILRGVNAGTRSKFYPFIPFAYIESGLPQHEDAPPFEQACDDFFDRMASWGHNLVRLPFSWEGIEPERGSYDNEYLDRYLAMVNAAAERGIRVIVDFHQDVFAWPYCGDGFPLWSLPQPVPDRPADCTDWFVGYFDSPEVRGAFDRFWSNQDGLRDDFEDMWRHVASRCWPAEGVIGFEIINEPAAGTADEQIWAKEVLTPFYAEMATMIREAAPEAPVVFDSSGVSSATARTDLDLPAGESLIFAPHYYDATVMVTGEWTGGTDLGEMMGRWKTTADEWGVPCLLGEFGIQASFGGAPEYLRAIHDAIDIHRLHATVWEYSNDPEDWNDEGYGLVKYDGEELPVTEEVIRAYPMAVAGRIDAYHFDASDREGRLQFEAEAGGITEIAAPSRLYPNGVEVRVEGGEIDWIYDPDTGRILIKAIQAGSLTIDFGPL